MMRIHTPIVILIVAVLIALSHASAWPQTNSELAALKNDPPKYVRALSAMISDAVKANQLDNALSLLDLFQPFPQCPELSTCRFNLAQGFRQAGNPDVAADLLQKIVNQDPWCREAPRAIEFLADIISSDLMRPEESGALLSKLAADYYPELPSVKKARETLQALPIPPSKMILLDASLGESTIYDRGPTGGSNFGLWEVIQTLVAAGYTVHSNDTIPRGHLTPEVLSLYGLVVLNGHYGGTDVPPIAQADLDTLVNYVNNGGSLLVVAAGRSFGEGRLAQFYNPLASKFGLRFAENASLKDETGKPSPDSPVQGLSEFRAPSGVPVIAPSSQMVAYCGDKPVIAVASYGRGQVMIAGVGSGFMGSCLRQDRGNKYSSENRRLLTRLAAYLLRPRTK